MSFDETTEPEPTVWEITRDGITEPTAIAGYTDCDRHLALVEFIGDDDDGWEGEAYDHSVTIRRYRPEREEQGQIYKVLIFRSIIEERKRR